MHDVVRRSSRPFRSAALVAVAAASVVATLAGPVAPLRASSDAPRTEPPPTDPFAIDAFAPPAGPEAVSLDESAVSYDAAADTVDIHVDDARVIDVLRMLAARSQRNIIASRDVAGTVTCTLYDVAVGEALDAILRGGGLAAREEGNFIYVYTQEELAALDEADRVRETRVFRVYHIGPEMASRMIGPALSELAEISFSDATERGMQNDPTDGGGYGYGGGDLLVVKDFPEHLDAADRLLQKVDARPEQVLVEATILSSTLTENNQFGVDFNLVGGVDFDAVNFLNGGQLGGGASVNGGEAVAVDDEIYGGGTGNNFAGPVNGGLKLGFVSGDVSVFLAALEGVTDTTVLANPKVLAVNKHKGEVLVGRQDGFITTTLTETAATQSVEFLETGTKLVFRPFVSRDGYVRMEIHPEDSAGGVDARGLPSKVTTQVTSNVLVKDGHTIVIGGLFRESTTVGRSQIPVLGNLPLVGAAFRRQADATTREEIIILLTPHIVKDLDRYSELSERELARAELLRVGTRRGMMPWGRERMAQSYYEKAIAELDKPEPNGRPAPASTRERGPALEPVVHRGAGAEAKRSQTIISEEADNSTIRDFVRRAIREDELTIADPEERRDREAHEFHARASPRPAVLLVGCSSGPSQKELAREPVERRARCRCSPSSPASRLAGGHLDEARRQSVEQGLVTTGGASAELHVLRAQILQIEQNDLAAARASLASAAQALQPVAHTGGDGRAPRRRHRRALAGRPTAPSRTTPAPASVAAGRPRRTSSPTPRPSSPPTAQLKAARAASRARLVYFEGNAAVRDALGPGVRSCSSEHSRRRSRCTARPAILSPERPLTSPSGTPSGHRGGGAASRGRCACSTKLGDAVERLARRCCSRWRQCQLSLNRTTRPLARATFQKCDAAWTIGCWPPWLGVASKLRRDRRPGACCRRRRACVGAGAGVAGCVAVVGPDPTSPGPHRRGGGHVHQVGAAGRGRLDGAAAVRRLPAASGPARRGAGLLRAGGRD